MIGMPKSSDDHDFLDELYDGLDVKPARPNGQRYDDANVAFTDETVVRALPKDLVRWIP
jgi:hypothetical protein